MYYGHQYLFQCKKNRDCILGHIFYCSFFAIVYCMISGRFHRTKQGFTDPELHSFPYLRYMHYLYKSYLLCHFIFWKHVSSLYDNFKSRGVSAFKKPRSGKKKFSVVPVWQRGFRHRMSYVYGSDTSISDGFSFHDYGYDNVHYPPR